MSPSVLRLGLPTELVHVLSLKISRSSPALADGGGGGGEEGAAQVSMSALCVSPGHCAVSVLAVVFVGGISRRTHLILFPQKQDWEDKKCVCFIHPGGSL